MPFRGCSDLPALRPIVDRASLPQAAPAVLDLAETPGAARIARRVRGQVSRPTPHRAQAPALAGAIRRAQAGSVPIGRRVPSPRCVAALGPAAPYPEPLTTAAHDLHPLLRIDLARIDLRAPSKIQPTGRRAKDGVPVGEPHQVERYPLTQIGLRAAPAHPHGPPLREPAFPLRAR